MSKVFVTMVFLLSMAQVQPSFAQVPSGNLKVYSGYLYPHAANSNTSFWRALFNPKASKPKEVDLDSQCSLEFHSPAGFSNLSADVMPQQLSYFIKFKKPAFDKFYIRIYTNDGEDYTVDPASEGRQVGINDEHHIFDTYVIYLILGSGINHIEVAGPAGDDGDKYILDKIEFRSGR